MIMHDWYDENLIVGESWKLLGASKVHSWYCYYVGCSDSEFDIFDAVDKERMQEEQVCAFWKISREIYLWDRSKWPTIDVCLFY